MPQTQTRRRVEDICQELDEASLGGHCTQYLLAQGRNPGNSDCPRIRVSLEHLGGTCKALVGLERAFPRTRPSVPSWLPSPSRTQQPSNCSFPHCVASGAASQQPHDITTPSRTARPLESSPDTWVRPSWSQRALLLRSRVCSLSFLLNNHNQRIPTQKSTSPATHITTL